MRADVIRYLSRKPMMVLDVRGLRVRKAAAQAEI